MQCTSSILQSMDTLMSKQWHFSLVSLPDTSLSSTLLLPVVYILGYKSTLLLSSWTINLLAFLLSANSLYYLSMLLLNDRKLALKATLLYCINPASIFMTSAYTESVFAFFQFSGLYFLETKRPSYLKASLLFACGALARSNGLISVGFLVHSKLRHSLKDVFRNNKNIAGIKQICMKFCVPVINGIVNGIIFAFIVLFSFCVYQMYGYFLYCSDNKEVKKPSWCNNSVPFSYNYIQSYYWNVGFMRYYEIKQIPNFVLVLPMVVLSINALWSFFKKGCSWNIIATLGLKENSSSDSSHQRTSKQNPGYFSEKMFVYMVHLAFLLFFGLANIHVQVLTRLLCSSSPVIYWYLAYITTGRRHIGIIYFLVYFFVGTMLHCSFYPWT